MQSNLGTPQGTTLSPIQKTNVPTFSNFSLNCGYHRSMPFNQPNYYYNGNQMYQQLPQNQMRHRTFTNFPQQNFCTSLPFNYRGSVGTFGKGNSMSSCNPYSMGNQNVKGNLFCFAALTYIYALTYITYYHSLYYIYLYINPQEHFFH